jgi:GAF domain-containing protein
VTGPEVSAPVAAAQEQRAVLQAIAETAAGLLGARGASIAVVDAVARDAVFAAVAGEGREELVGGRFPAGEGIAGAVLGAGEPVVVDDLDADTRWARDVATASGYLPGAIAAVPLLHENRAIGVLSVLDRSGTRPAADDLALLDTLAHLALVALGLQAPRR